MNNLNYRINYSTQHYIKLKTLLVCSLLAEHEGNTMSVEDLNHNSNPNIDTAKTSHPAKHRHVIPISKLQWLSG